MKEKAYRLLVTAHPDDETIFFGGLLQRKKALPWKVICVTDGNADGRGAERALEFKAATKLLGVKDAAQFNFPDRFPGRLDVAALEALLKELPAPREVYTHGPMGEYGHPHHQDVCLATHRAFPRVRIYAPAWNTMPEQVVKISPSEFKKKTRAFSQIYRKETGGFLNLLPNTAVENFCRFRRTEVEALVGFLRGEKELDLKALDRYQWLGDQMPSLKKKFSVRLFGSED